MKQDGRGLDRRMLETMRLMAVERASSVISSYRFNRTTIYKWIKAASRNILKLAPYCIGVKLSLVSWVCVGTSGFRTGCSAMHHCSSGFLRIIRRVRFAS